MSLLQIMGAETAQIESRDIKQVIENRTFQHHAIEKKNQPFGIRMLAPKRTSTGGNIRGQKLQPIWKKCIHVGVSKK